MSEAGLTVLLVDDSLVIRRVLSKLLDRDPRIGRVFEASDAAEGYSLFKVSRPDAVVLDLELPDLHGLEVLKRMKSADPSCVVIIVTSVDAAEIREECLRLGANRFLNKEHGLGTIPDMIAALCPNTPRDTGNGKLPKGRSKTSRQNCR
jgi:DNA-binding NarL/FixJ family response regulator